MTTVSVNSETAFNFRMREILRAQGLRCLHVRDTDTPGVCDLLVWHRRYDGEMQAIWLELKIGDEELRPSQIEFMHNESSEGAPTYVVRLYGERHVKLSVPILHRKGSFTMVREIDDFKTFNWPNFLFSK